MFGREKIKNLEKRLEALEREKRGWEEKGNRLTRIERLLRLSEITAEGLDKKLLAKLGQGWGFSRQHYASTEIGTDDTHRWSVFSLDSPDGTTFAEGDDKLDMLEEALSKKKEAQKNFCNKPAKKPRKKK